MPDRSESQSVPSALRQIALYFRLTGWISFWSQLVLAVVSSVVLLLFGVFSRSPGGSAGNPGTGFGIFFALCGLAILGGSIYWTFRYTRIARQLESPYADTRPRKSDTIQLLRMGLMVNLAGMLSTLLGAYAIVGTLAARSISQPQTGILTDTTRLISSLDMFAVQANINTIAGHFVGIVATLWLLNRINRT
ncbi:DUF3611 family protein [Aerosakkonema funiforme]|uniref:DUF3611 family protein n=1 Tax=Aerosakkonema funiforme FACHB-1375 TaxID=2949571 RepID=A0A926ZHJ8_9CYAN|nr:DUF3611 family protein [Aerosakkonema funiforme]MBD2182242.1 DUF3611 family protein [Aerosakkonema funiforme FACHB-1375]